MAGGGRPAARSIRGAHPDTRAAGIYDLRPLMVLLRGANADTGSKAGCTAPNAIRNSQKTASSRAEIPRPACDLFPRPAAGSDSHYRKNSEDGPGTCIGSRRMTRLLPKLLCTMESSPIPLLSYRPPCTVLTRNRPGISPVPTSTAHYRAVSGDRHNDLD